MRLSARQETVTQKLYSNSSSKNTRPKDHEVFQRSSIEVRQLQWGSPLQETALVKVNWIFGNRKL